MENKTFLLICASIIVAAVVIGFILVNVLQPAA